MIARAQFLPQLNTSSHAKIGQMHACAQGLFLKSNKWATCNAVVTYHLIFITSGTLSIEHPLYVHEFQHTLASMLYVPTLKFIKRYETSNKINIISRHKNLWLNWYAVYVYLLDCILGTGCNAVSFYWSEPLNYYHSLMCEVFQNQYTLLHPATK